jgi:hypothetical protein
MSVGRSRKRRIVSIGKGIVKIREKKMIDSMRVPFSLETKTADRAQARRTFDPVTVHHTYPNSHFTEIHIDTLERKGFVYWNPID